MDGISATFWCLEQDTYRFVELAWQVAGQNGEFKHAPGRYGLDEVTEWCAAKDNSNVFRSLRVYRSKEGEDSVIRPYLIDIDNEQEDLDDALCIAVSAVKYLSEKPLVGPARIKAFFSGRKGFHLEIDPRELERGQNPIQCYSKLRDEIIHHLQKGQSFPCKNQVSVKGTVIDPITEPFHCHIRLPASWNAFQTDTGLVKMRRFEIALRDLPTISVNQVLARASECAE